MRNQINNILGIAFTMSVLLACQPSKKEDEKPQMAIAELNPTEGNTLTGSVFFTQIGEDTVEISATLQGGSEGMHAIHLHEKGDCSASDGSSAGGHWNPDDSRHGNRQKNITYHKGDIANMEFNSLGEGSMTMQIVGWNIQGDDDSDILEKAVIVHKGADDFVSQPSGDAGERVACGVITLSAE